MNDELPPGSIIGIVFAIIILIFFFLLSCICCYVFFRQKYLAYREKCKNNKDVLPTYEDVINERV